jgi:hypothetical protein
MFFSGKRYLEPIINIMMIRRIDDDLLSLRVKPNQFFSGSLFNFIFTKCSKTDCNIQKIVRKMAAGTGKLHCE